MQLPIEDKKYNFSDYLNWPDEERWELIDGVAYMLSAPTWQHQAISGEIFTQFNIYFKNNPCRVFSSPFDLRIPEFNEKDEETTTVVQPDILVVCEKERLKGSGYYGVPSLIIEITSPSTAKIDKILKFNKYEKAGVKEYWIVEPDVKIVNVFTLGENNRYGRPELYTEEDKVTVTIFSELVIDLNSVFAEV